MGRVGWSVLLALFVLALLGGFRPFIGWLSTWVVALLFPPAAGLPSLWPPLRLTPLGDTSVTVWLIDLLGAAVMLITAWVWLRTASIRRPFPGRARAFGRGLSVTIVAVIAGNVVRGVAQSFLLHADLGTYLGQLLGNLIVSALTGLLLGVIVGAVAALAARQDDTPQMVGIASGSDAAAKLSTQEPHLDRR